MRAATAAIAGIIDTHVGVFEVDILKAPVTLRHKDSGTGGRDGGQVARLEREAPDIAAAIPIVPAGLLAQEVEAVDLVGGPQENRLAATSAFKALPAEDDASSPIDQPDARPAPDQSAIKGRVDRLLDQVADVGCRVGGKDQLAMVADEPFQPALVEARDRALAIENLLAARGVDLRAIAEGDGGTRIDRKAAIADELERAGDGDVVRYPVVAGYHQGAFGIGLDYLDRIIGDAIPDRVVRIVQRVANLLELAGDRPERCLLLLTEADTGRLRAQHQHIAADRLRVEAIAFLRRDRENQKVAAAGVVNVLFQLDADLRQADDLARAAGAIHARLAAGRDQRP